METDGEVMKSGALPSVLSSSENNLLLLVDRNDSGMGASGRKAENWYSLGTYLPTMCCLYIIWCNQYEESYLFTNTEQASTFNVSGISHISSELVLSHNFSSYVQKQKWGYSVTSPSFCCWHSVLPNAWLTRLSNLSSLESSGDTWAANYILPQ